MLRVARKEARQSLTVAARLCGWVQDRRCGLASVAASRRGKMDAPQSGRREQPEKRAAGVAATAERKRRREEEEEGRLVAASASADKGRPRAPLRGILTWNVWFEPFQFEARAAAVFANIAARRPAVVALQEVTPRFLALLLRERWATESYAFSTVDTTEGDWIVNTARGGVCPYGCVLLVDRALQPIFHVVPLPSQMDRSLVLSYLLLPGGAELTVCTVHLESLGTQPTRERQLRTISRALDPAGGPAVVTGDVNFDSRRNWSARYETAQDGVCAPGSHTAAADNGEGALSHSSASGSSACSRLVEAGPELDNDCLTEILPGWFDLWPTVRPDELGFTFDSAINTNAALGTHRAGAAKYEQMRYDRILMAPELKPGLGGATIELVGVEEDPLSGCAPSDHFGLFTNWDLNLTPVPSATLQDSLSGCACENGTQLEGQERRMTRDLTLTYESDSSASESPSARWMDGMFDSDKSPDEADGVDEHGSMMELMGAAK